METVKYLHGKGTQEREKSLLSSFPLLTFFAIAEGDFKGYSEYCKYTLFHIHELLSQK